MRKILLALLAAFGAAAFANSALRRCRSLHRAGLLQRQLVHFLLPSASSANPTEQVVADCFRRLHERFPTLSSRAQRRTSC